MKEIYDAIVTMLEAAKPFDMPILAAMIVGGFFYLRRSGRDDKESLERAIARNERLCRRRDIAIFSSIAFISKTLKGDKGVEAMEPLSKIFNPDRDDED